MNKSAIRKQMKAAKKALSSEYIYEKSRQIFERLIETKEFKSSERVYIYVNYNQEVSTLDIINLCQAAGKKVFVPKIIGDEMIFVRLNSIDELKSGSFGILEPASNEADTSCCGLLVMPLLAFDTSMNRLGYGGGYYDRYLEKHTNNIKLGLAYDFQRTEGIDTDTYDIPLDMVITPERIYIKGDI